MRSGKKGKMFRALVTQKKGYPLPHTELVSGPTDLTVMHNDEGYYVGREYRLTTGALTPYTRESKYTDSKKSAENYLKTITGKLKLEIKDFDHFDFEVFDLCDSFLNSLQDRIVGFQKPGVFSIKFTRLENDIKDILGYLDIADYNTSMDLINLGIAKRPH